MPLRPAPPPSASRFATLKLKASKLFGADASGEGTVRASPVFKPQRPSALSFAKDVQRAGEEDEHTIPILPEARRLLGMNGTLGGADTSIELDASDPDSDVPDELRMILSSSRGQAAIEENDTLSFVPTPAAARDASPPSSPFGDGPPVLELPIFVDRAASEEEEGFEEDENEPQMGRKGEEDTKKSFDFTGEIRKLSESNTSDRASFLEQLERAFETPAKVDFRGIAGTLLAVDVPSVPKIPVLFAQLGSGSGSETSSIASGLEGYPDLAEKLGNASMREPAALLHLNMMGGDEEVVEDAGRLLSRSRSMFMGLGGRRRWLLARRALRAVRAKTLSWRHRRSPDGWRPQFRMGSSIRHSRLAQDPSCRCRLSLYRCSRRRMTSR